MLTTAPESEMDLPDLAVEKGVTVAGQVILTDGKLPPAETRVSISREEGVGTRRRVWWIRAERLRLLRGRR